MYLRGMIDRGCIFKISVNNAKLVTIMPIISANQGIWTEGICDGTGLQRYTRCIIKLGAHDKKMLSSVPSYEAYTTYTLLDFWNWFVISSPAQTPQVAGMDWTMKREQSRLSATGETGTGGGTEKGMKMVSLFLLIPLVQMLPWKGHLDITITQISVLSPGLPPQAITFLMSSICSLCGKHVTCVIQMWSLQQICMVQNSCFANRKTEKKWPVQCPPMEFMVEERLKLLPFQKQE